VAVSTIEGLLHDSTVVLADRLRLIAPVLFWPIAMVVLLEQPLLVFVTTTE